MVWKTNFDKLDYSEGKCKCTINLSSKLLRLMRKKRKKYNQKQEKKKCSSNPDVLFVVFSYLTFKRHCQVCLE